MKSSGGAATNLSTQMGIYKKENYLVRGKSVFRLQDYFDEDGKYKDIFLHNWENGNWMVITVL